MMLLRGEKVKDYTLLRESLVNIKDHSLIQLTKEELNPNQLVFLRQEQRKQEQKCQDHRQPSTNRQNKMLK